MDLKKYIESRRFELKEFARMIGISPSTLSNYIHKRREPRPWIRKRIIEVTGGKVGLEDLLEK
jgi:transcriptional regulator with XRE-family HTH domain